MRIAKFAGLVLPLVLASACSDVAAPPRFSQPSESLAAIVNGTPTGSAYGNVGALFFDFDADGVTGGDLLCTGSLITPTVYLTAGHCIWTPWTTPSSQFYVSFASD